MQSQQLCNISPTVDGRSTVKFEAMKASETRDVFWFDAVVSSGFHDDPRPNLMECVKKGGFFKSSAAPAALLQFVSSWVEAAWPALVDAPPCHILDCFHFFLSDALLAACRSCRVSGN